MSDEIQQILKFDNMIKDEDDYQITIPESLLDKKFRILFTLLTFGIGFTHGYSNIKIQNSVGDNHLQLLVFSMICICNWLEAKQFLGKYDIFIGSFSFLLCALIDSKNMHQKEIFFVFWSFALFFSMNIFCFFFQSSGTPSYGQLKDPQIQLHNQLMISQEDQVNDLHKKISQLNSNNQKKALYLQYPNSQSMRYSGGVRPSEKTLDGQLNNTAHFKKIYINNHYQTNLQTFQQSEMLIQDNKMSRILISNQTPNQNTKANLIVSVQESMNQHILFYKGMIDKLDSAIFVIGGPNQVYEPLNSKAETFFANYFQELSIKTVDFTEIFKQIVIKNFNKSCFEYLESIGISRVDCFDNTTPKQKFQEKAIIQSFFNQYSNSVKPPTYTNKTSYQLKQQNTLQSNEHQIDEDNVIEQLKIKKNESKFSNNFSFQDITLFGLIEKMLGCKQKCCSNDKDNIEIIEFTTTKELNEILKFVQIKLYGYQLGDDKFLFLKFVKNQEREELMRETIHKDIEYSTFKTISHELGTYINFMLLILEGAILDKTIPQNIKEDYFQNLSNNAQFLNSIIQDIRDYQSNLNGNLKVQIKSTQIKPLIIKSCLIFTQITKMKDIEFEVLINDDVPTKIFTDKMKIQQILIHLIQNSLKFSNSKSSVCVSVSMIQDTLDQKQKFICFSVADSGIGMDAEEQKRLRQLLDNIYLSEKVSIHSSGFGFGLTISNILAKKIHSSKETKSTILLEEFAPGIHFTSVKNVGSEFRFYINTSDSESIVAQSVSNETHSRFSRIRIKDYEYFEHEDDKEIYEKETNEAEKNMELKVVEQLGEINATSTIQKSNIRTLSKKITYNFEKSKDKSRYFGNTIYPKESLEQQIKQGIIGMSTNKPNKLTVERKAQKKYTHSFLINSIIQKKLETNLNLSDYDIEEEVKAGIIPNHDKQIDSAQNLKIQPSFKVLEDKHPKKSIIFTKTLFDRISNNQNKILIADDEMMNIFGLKMMLKILGVDQGSILQANNGEEAVNIFAQNLKDKTSIIKLIIMDINMPILDGIEATKQINDIIQKNRQQGYDVGETNIVACSSYDDYDTKLQCLQAGMVSYLSKPCNKDNLSHIVLKYFQNEKILPKPFNV